MEESYDVVVCRAARNDGKRGYRLEFHSENAKARVVQTVYLLATVSRGTPLEPGAVRRFVAEIRKDGLRVDDTVLRIDTALRHVHVLIGGLLVLTLLGQGIGKISDNTTSSIVSTLIALWIGIGLRGAIERDPSLVPAPTTVATQAVFLVIGFIVFMGFIAGMLWLTKALGTWALALLPVYVILWVLVSSGMAYVFKRVGWFN